MKKKLKTHHTTLKLLIIIPLMCATSIYFTNLVHAQDRVMTSAELQTQQQTAVEVPFAVVEEVPVFPGCEELSQAEQKTCITNKINDFVNRNFDLSLPEKLGIKGHSRVTVRFKINSSGEVVEVEARGPHPELSAEGERVIQSLPKMLPGKQRGKEVTVLYAVPINLTVPQ